MPQTPALFFKLTFLLLITSIGAKADLLDSVKEKTKQLNDLKDVYRAFNIKNIIADQQEFIELSVDEAKAYNSRLLRDYIKTCDSLKHVHFFDNSLSAQVGSYLASTIQNYRVGIQYGIGSAAFKKDAKRCSSESNKYMSYLIKSYPMNHFVDLTEKEYWGTVNKDNYIKSAEYTSYKSLKKTNVKAGIALLTTIANHTANFQEHSIYEIEIADQYVKHSDILDDDAQNIAINKYKAILDKGKYSIYLFESWVKWRCVLQQTNGLSKSSDIPNDLYNELREKTALIILNTIAADPKNKMAINQFLDIATHDIVRRFGEYPYGNQNTVEYHEIFDEKK
ncbi:hypothetical protein C8P68_102570 [Mucilaginibacter yixingensis]|uniref:Imelysin-like domain-containing protein n=1 Tax=Mucilaginibacter yixingensis TaxID=1295612 RepID=A0A2T5JD94_9SPHI|nr:hypothetical protein [Mucilaginibacter yixingensis]PTQ99740.1 hypothetical protein C8P68_102570 [Mucilaginibacter yixingensis]